MCFPNCVLMPSRLDSEDYGEGPGMVLGRFSEVWVEKKQQCCFPGRLHGPHDLPVRVLCFSYQFVGGFMVLLGGFRVRSSVTAVSIGVTVFGNFFSSFTTSFNSAEVLSHTCDLTTCSTPCGTVGKPRKSHEKTIKLQAQFYIPCNSFARNV